ncbi:SoxR reducing system RseC family protein [Sedimenticola selenatireducens]|uniref:SoxR reducing system RseC family protein n=1 Tax=Sedimenticola selenatireducens TaxID=191960 RepID=A0A557RZG1_9GAMM|nr:SoxR reducing system RseC family protein [Sedimenticola selenatireducens]TVO70534.1 SoxR reducing system RseC family protein [Sedimenticola selenatireducens]TVT63111.1 MAG: SoxR reducing system RseC family protein [Sedimenticola selenatireducens]
MIEETAIVTATQGEFAQVETQRQSSCGGCEAKSTCGTSALAKVFGNRRNLVEVLNPIGAVTGDRVVVGLDESALTRASFLFYILPLFTLLTGALLGQWLGEIFNFKSTEPLSIICGLLGLLGGLYWLRGFASRNRRNSSLQAVILRHANRVQIINGID